MSSMKIPSDQEALIISMYKQGRSACSIGREMNFTATSVSRILKRNGVTVVKPRQRIFTDQEESEIHLEYMQTKNATPIAARLGCARTTIISIVRRHGGEAQLRGNRAKQFSDEQKRQMETDWNAGLSQSEIGRKIGANQIMVSRLLRSLGIQPRTRHRCGSNHSQWKGGRIISSGYVMVRMDTNDELACMRGYTGYVLEHRLAMARHLGRPLSVTETVHHINGDRRDNRLENLQLRQGLHGRGAAFQCSDCGSHNIIAVKIKD